MAYDVTLSGTNSNLLSGAIKWSGLSSGIDFASVVDQLVAIERTSIDRLELWKSSWEDKITSIQGLNSRMSSLKSFCEEFDTFEEFYSRTSASSDTSVVTTSNTSSASPGSHNLVVGSTIPGRVASRSYDSTAGVGGTGGTLTINVGSSSVSLVEGVDFNDTDTIDQLATAINTKDDAGSDLLEPVVTVVDKDRSGTTYKRLIITAKSGGASNPVSVSDPTSLNLDTNSVDAVYEKTWVGTSSASSGGTYTGSTNKTFTFRIATAGVSTVGTDDFTVQWADTEGNSGSFTVSAAATNYDVFQGITVQFAAGNVVENDSFTIDAYNPTLQAAQDKGLAQVEQRVHDGFIDLLTSVTTVDGTFSYYYEGVQTTVNITANSKLQDLADAINEDPNNRGVVASIINDGENTATSYHLVLTGKDTGAEHTITNISETLDSFAGGDSDFATTQSATNSMLKVDGFPTADYEYLQRSTNSVSDVLAGVTLALQDAGSAVVTISNDLATIKTGIETFVNSVNFVQDYIRQETKYNAETGESGTMLGNYSYSLVRDMINDILSGSIPGLTDGTDTYIHLGQIGIETDPDQDGKWVLDLTALDTALNQDLEAVARLFVRDDDRGSSGVCEQLRDKMEELTDAEEGIGNVLIDNYNGIISDIDTRIEREERRVKMVKERLEERFARLETLLATLEGQSRYLELQLENLPVVKRSQSK